MKMVGAFEAKTHFSQLLEQVSRGETVIITRHGEAVAKLSPLATDIQKVSSPQAAIKAIRELRRGVTLGKNLTLKKLMTEGRK